MSPLPLPVAAIVTLTLALPALWIAGCGTEAAKAGRPQVADSAGVEIVENGQTGSWGGRPPVVTETLRIGVIEGDEPYQFHQVYSLAVDAEGRVFVGNNQTGSVRAFAQDGSFLAEFGRKGRGPGEFNMVNRVWLAGDSVVITDWQAGGRTSVFTKDGLHVATWRSTRPDGSRIEIVAFGPQGWIASINPPYDPPDIAPGEPWIRTATLRRFDPVADTAGVGVFTFPPSVLYASPETEGMDWALFQPGRSSAFDGSGNIYFSHGEPYRIDVHDPSGRLIRSIRRSYEPKSIGPDDVEELKALVTARYDTIQATATRNPRRDLERVLRRIDNQATFPMPAYQAPLGRLLVSHDGSFWVERVDLLSPARMEYERLYGGVSRAQPRPTRWDLHDTAGYLLGTVDLHPRFTPMAVRGTSVTGVLKDELDVEYIVTYEVTAG